MAMKYKVGDKVRVKKWEDLELEYEVDEDGYICHGVVFNDEMREYCGKELVIGYVGMDEYLCHGNNWLWQDWMFEDVDDTKLKIQESEFDPRIIQKGLIGGFTTKELENKIDHELVILQLTELNALKTRQLDELTKYIAHLVPKAHKEYLSHHLNDVQLIDGIMYHVRKGK